ncbi:ATP-binding protein [Bifidobacterium simiiventris]|uniref:ATP-binding protein n=1 Tax=Bifidobacterium simiiventris TaxID=2834434 RepID=UPI001C56F2FE|nr:ATP-binding protein [Bifidobacterium simiiventris]MBW3077983.1 putative DNA binding domain-containing protein [Bifidobacterium simiiventris]
MAADLQQLIRDVIANKCETQTIEVKAAAEGTPRVYDSLSSFSNQNEGGIILFGIDEQAGFSICGVYDAQDLHKKVHGQCEGMTPEVRPTFETTTINGKTVVAAYISGRPMGDRPVYRTIKGITEGSYTRIGDADVRMTAVELYEIESFKEGRRDDIATNPTASSAMLDKRKTSRFINDAAADRPLLSRRSDDEILALTGAIRDGRPTLAGMMTLGDYPQQIYPNLCITAIAVNGTTLQPDENGTRFLDNKRYEGSISDMLEGAMSFVSRNEKTKVVVRNGARVDVPQYPETAVREILLNALMHRDYGPYSNGTPIRLVLYTDRLECWNPGGIYGGQSINDLGYANLPTRNPTLVSMLEIQRIAENRHSGIPIIREEAQSHGVRPPEFIDRNGSFLARFFNTEQHDDDSRPHEPTAGKGSKHTRDIRSQIAEYCQTPRFASEIASHFDYNLQYLKRSHLQPMVEARQLTLTLPGKPHSKYQQYLTTGTLEQTTITAH